ncbi:hypothetical protein Dtox_2765 [Desulfofarcimen acetoxidans DSM 771]|uniref:Uncharacterized protein n=1 Tax=Desulfofarcimen acetoxidans (strain ATCC 49208 / DSM 771 / KCTC 5769 / VKM B-1644 / 5575) TaxID=485916 RepID=C8W1R7_DESAS|nr:hypothetical protein [Desulfofarcimen acetoxidans]ACV63538.1 hypothetical protein Dtox_2765 [Desulfofarcimen acetoxidans DSM 771]
MQSYDKGENGSNLIKVFKLGKSLAFACPLSSKGQIIFILV